MKNSFILDKSANSSRSTATNRKQVHKQQPFFPNSNAQSLQATRVHKNTLHCHPNNLSQRSSNNNKSIMDDFKFEDSRVLNMSNSQTLSVKKKPLNLSNSSGTSMKTSREEKEFNTTGDYSNKSNLLKWHRRIHTYSKDYNNKVSDNNTSKYDDKEGMESDTPRRYSFRSNKNDKTVLVENQFKEQPTAKELNPKAVHLKFSSFTSKYTPTDLMKERREKTECFNDEADKNLKQFLKNKLGIGTINNQNQRYF